MKFIITFALFIVLFVVALALGSGNDQLVVFNYMLAESTFRLSTLIAVAFGVGFIVAWILSAFFLFKMKWRLVATQHQLKKLQEERTKAHEEQQRQSLESV